MRSLLIPPIVAPSAVAVFRVCPDGIFGVGPDAGSHRTEQSRSVERRLP
jgi:hypothetical protein